jgi:PAS domain S-box-containing protein
MKGIKPTYQELKKRLAEAESVVEALKHHEVDAVVGEKKIAFLLLKEVTETLLDSEAGFRAMFELSGVGMFQADSPAFCFTRVNRKFCEMMGYSAEELLTKTYIGLTHSKDHLRDMTGLTRVLRGKANSWSIQKHCVRKNGTAVRVEVNAAVLRNESGQALRIMGMISQAAGRNGDKPARLKTAAVRKTRASKRSI